MAIDIGYTPSQTIGGWGTAQESKSESRTWNSSHSGSSNYAGWNPWQKRLASPWTALWRNHAIPQMNKVVDQAFPNMWDTVQRVLQWNVAPPEEYTAGREALLNSFKPTATEDFYQNAIRAPMLREWEQVERPGLREAYGGDYYHSERMRREAELARDKALALAKTYADLRFQSEEEAKQRALQGAPIALNYAQYIPQTQMDFLRAYLGTTTPLLQALTNYMSQRLRQTGRSSTTSHGGGHSVTHYVSGWRPKTSVPAAPVSQPAPVAHMAPVAGMGIQGTDWR